MVLYMLFVIYSIVKQCKRVGRGMWACSLFLSLDFCRSITLIIVSVGNFENTGNITKFILQVQLDWDFSLFCVVVHYWFVYLYFLDSSSWIQWEKMRRIIRRPKTDASNVWSIMWQVTWLLGGQNGGLQYRHYRLLYSKIHKIKEMTHS